ncbi:pyridoxamine 5'-phosphate oxidase family protein [Streptomyces caniscabiei]|nr:MSMEG_1061 family FMN-dependent PPOX-type flavoprotein [Streptomyces caniscabiei]MDX2604327.1 pyridoxamine 5'-phosphate oxidase family protein [Streptomyces caniscabiei]MDX2735669.1 pyridoxamine 5'-phosphate oxidase family protein [Streptomyces caniscabiei]MDX2779679.1 pyridoxamine 5'-phosphate oxidase family protein [Streptomyces caniscabiei]
METGAGRSGDGWSEGGWSEAGWVGLDSREALRELLGEPWPVVIEKVHDRLTGQDRDILARSPFCLLATSDARGGCDVSPRGDAPGFTHVVGPGVIALPDRPGNRRGDSLHNILDNPHAGLLYLIPGSKEVLRINGWARILTDAPFFDAMTLDDRRPVLALVLEIDEIYLHCPQSLRRSGVWDPRSWRTG